MVKANFGLNRKKKKVQKSILTLQILKILCQNKIANFSLNFFGVNIST